MKVLQLISTSGFYGAESMVLNLSVALAERGHHVRVGVLQSRATPKNELSDRACLSGLNVKSFECTRRVDVSVLRAITELVEEFRPEIVHSHGYKADAYAALARRAGSALVATCHNWTNKSRALRFYATLDRLILRRFNLVVCVSNEVQRRLVGAGVKPNRTAVLQNGVDTRAFSQCNGTLDRGPATVLIGMVGRLVREKGFQLVLDAAPRIIAKYPHARFVLVGDGPERVELAERAAQLGLSGYVSFLGARSDMPGVYRSLDVLVLPSLNEGMPMTLLEARAAGVPVIATRVGSIPDTIDHGTTGLLVAPGDSNEIERALAYLLAHPSERSRIGRAGQDWTFANASATAMADQYLAHYAAALTSIPPLTS